MTKASTHMPIVATTTYPLRADHRTRIDRSTTALIGVTAISAITVWNANRHSANGTTHANVGSSVLASHCHTTSPSTASAVWESGMLAAASASMATSTTTTPV